MTGGDAFGADRDVARYVSVPDAAALDLASFGVEVWVRVDEAPAVGESYALVAKGDNAVAAACNYYLGCINDAGTMRVEGSFVDGGGVLRQLLAAATLEVGRRYAIYYSFDDATKVARLYWSARRTGGEAPPAASYTLLATDTFAAVSPATNARALTIGAAIDAAGAAVDVARATLAEVRLFSAAQAVATREAQLTARAERGDADLAGYWRLDDGEGGSDTATAADRSGAGNDGTVQNPGSHWVDGPEDVLYRAGPWQGMTLGWRDALEQPDATATPTSEATEWEATYWFNGRAGSPTRTADAAGTHRWVVYLGTRPPPVALALILGHNLRSSAVILLEGNGADAWGAPAVSESITYHPGSIVWPLAREYQLPYWRLSLTDVGNPAGFYGVGQFSLMACADLGHGTRGVLGAEVALTDASLMVKGRAGVTVTRERSRARRVSIPTIGLRVGVSRHLRRLLREAGPHAWIASDPTRTRGVYGALIGAGEATQDGPSDGFRSHGEIVVMEDVP